MPALTQPPIGVAQNQADAQRLLAAQAVLYSRSKRARNARVLVTLLAAVALGVAAAVSRNADVPVGVVGGLVVLVVSQYAAFRQQSDANLATAMQEKFDTQVFQIPWNALNVRRTPTSQEVAAAAARYTDDRTRDWYPDTGTVHRPLDVVICQQANLGWGTSIHRKWAGLVAATVLLTVAVLVLVWWLAGFDAYEGMNILVLPAVPVLWEAVDELRRHLESAKLKDETQQVVLDTWRTGLSSAGVPVIRCREIQNEIVHIRQTNAQVPDWFDRRFRDSSERAMRSGADDMIEEARRHHKA